MTRLGNHFQISIKNQNDSLVVKDVVILKDLFETSQSSPDFNQKSNPSEKSFHPQLTLDFEDIQQKCPSLWFCFPKTYVLCLMSKAFLME